MFTSIWGKLSDTRARWHIFEAPWCTPRTVWIVYLTMDRGKTNVIVVYGEFGSISHLGSTKYQGRYDFYGSKMKANR
jgi:hypothetical protein